MNRYKHRTVLLNEVINSLNIHPDGIYVDGTFGHGGHSKAILSKLGEKGILIAIDRDPSAISFAKTIKDQRLFTICGTFSRLSNYIQEKKLMGKVNGILLDLGVSALQIENANRGFSFMQDGPLDMRMDQTHGKSAAEWLQKAKETDIAKVLKTFGEERFSKKIASAIVKRNRSLSPITRTKELLKIVTSIIPEKNKFKHPEKRTFQAIRIFINNELKEIELLLRSSLDILAQGGRLSIISFHSLEDRIVKHFMLSQSSNPKLPPKLPITEEYLKKMKNYRFRYLGKIMPSEREIAKNSRARSAVLRFAERTK